MLTLGSGEQKPIWSTGEEQETGPKPNRAIALQSQCVEGLVQASIPVGVASNWGSNGSCGCTDFGELQQFLGRPCAKK
jgi:hypothetical protein